MKFEAQNRRLLSTGVYLFVGVFALRLFALTNLVESQFLLPSGGDMQFYNDWAQHILRGNWTQQTAFYGLPLYAYLLAIIYKIVGYSPFVPGLLQAALDGGTAVLLYKIAAHVFAYREEVGSERFSRESERWQGRAIGVMAAVGWAFFQPAQTYSIILMPSSWLVFIFWFVVWQIVKRKQAPACWGLFLLGSLIGFTAMGIATILFLAPLVLAALFVRWEAAVSSRMVGAALIFAGIVMGASPAWIHNYYIARDPVFLSAHSGINFWIGNNPIATGYPRFPPGLHAGQAAMLQDSITVAERAAGHPLKRSEVSAYWSEKGSNWISRHPLDWLRLIGVKIKNFWNAYQYDDLSIITTLREQGIIVPGVGFGLIAALAIPGMLLALRRYPSSAWVVAAILLHMTSLLTVFVTERYRLAAVPGLLLFAAFGLWNLWHELIDADYQRAGVFAGCLACGVIFVSWPQSDETLWSLDSYNSGLQALAAGRLAVAKQKLDLAYAYSPANAELNFAEGNLHLALEDRAVAKSYYLSALVLDQQHAGAFNNLGLIALIDHDPALAAKCFRHAIQITPNDAKLHYLLAQADFASGQMKEASTQIDAALELLPERPEFKLLRAQIPSDRD